MTTKNYSLLVTKTINGKVLKLIVTTRPNINMNNAIVSFKSTYGLEFDKTGYCKTKQGEYRIVDVIPAGYQQLKKT